MRARAYVAEQLMPHLPIVDPKRPQPGQWRYYDYLVDPDVLDRLSLVVAATGVERLRDAPMGAYDHTVTITLVSPNADFEQAEDELEPALDDLITAIEDHLQLPWEPATKVLYRDRYLAWEVPVRVITSREA